MRTLASLTLSLALCGALPAGAAPLQFKGTLGIAIGALPLPPLAATGTALVNGGPGGAVGLQGGAISTGPGGKGTIQLVSPLVVFTNLGLNFQGLATMSLKFVPEPGVGLVALGTIAALLTLARRR